MKKSFKKQVRNLGLAAFGTGAIMTVCEKDMPECTECPPDEHTTITNTDTITKTDTVINP
ncbi:MAG: hypothetical protein LBT04_07550 [Prevotellaceae bacterium]|jgi:adenine-specific DNA glycosylase|nr:hypothetical protein [Prevotellaceae bacterium]